MEACYTCRRRRIQCDRSSTPCQKCQKAGLECVDKRPVRWVQGVAIRGGMRGRSYDNSSVSLMPVEQFPARSASVARTPEVKPSMEVAKIAPAMSSIPLSISDTTLDSSARYYLEYYNDRICQLFIVLDSENNPFRNLISLALSDKTLLDAALALAARHRANAAQPFSLNGVNISLIPADADRDALRYKYRAIHGLSRSIGTRDAYSDATVASVFLLVFLDLLESGCDRWNYHLEGAKSLMALKPSSDPGRTLERIRTFIVKQIHLIEALGATFVRPELLSTPSPVDHSENLLQDVVEESFLGCPEYILTAVQAFSLQRDALAHGTSTNARHSETQSVLDTIKQFDAFAWASSHSQKPLKHHIDELCRLARTYQYGAIIYGQRVLDAFDKKQTNQCMMVSELIFLITSLQGSNLLKCALWPIIVAGFECQAQPQREMLIHALDKFWEDTKCLNVMNAAKILQDFWTKTDDNQAVASDWIFETGRLSDDWLLI
ncbi:fungal-specific transcription factor domain-containing protein [Aspergillus unguis]